MQCRPVVPDRDVTINFDHKQKDDNACSRGKHRQQTEKLFMDAVGLFFINV